VAWAADGGGALEIVGAATKRGWGRPMSAAAVLDLSGLTGVDMYEPEELVMTAKPGTRLSEIAAMLSRHRQRLAFEPPDLSPLLGGAEDGQTVGGVFAANLAGPRRFQAGAARDHLLGFTAVSGRAEIFKSGGRVVKNVTGFDLSKLMAGSFGTLAVLTSVTFKVLPVPDEVRTLAFAGAGDAAAIAALSRALQSPYDVTGAAHLPADAAAMSAVGRVGNAGGAVTLLRVEGPGPAVVPRVAALRELLAGAGELFELDADVSARLWREIRDLAAFAPTPDHQVWRVSVPPAEGARVAARALDRTGGSAIYDWGGGLVWLFLPPAADAHEAVVRGALGLSGGHATLIRATEDVRARVAVFQPEAAETAALIRRIKENFDPENVLNPGRMYADV
jgi:glycolate oxidase FAD binding subunit